MVQYLIAGGTRALGEATEANEDSPELGLRDMAAKRPSRKDVVVALSASGQTPYTLAALECARRRRGHPLESPAIQVRPWPGRRGLRSWSMSGRRWSPAPRA